MSGEAVSSPLPAVPAQWLSRGFSIRPRRTDRFAGHCLMSDLLDADVAETRLACGPPCALAAMNLQPDVTFARVTVPVVLKIGHLHVVEPGDDVRGLAFDSRAQFVPGVLLEIFLPIFVLLNEAACGRSVDAADKAVFTVINRDLIAHPVVADAQEQPRVHRQTGL